MQIPSKELQPLYQKKLEQFAQYADFPGFRKGKVPVNVVKERLGERINDEVINEIAFSAMDEFLKKEKLSVYGRPYIQDEDVKKNFDAEKPLKLSIAFFLAPTCKIKTYDSLVLEENTFLLDDGDVEQTFQRLMRPYGRLVEVQDEIKCLDIVEMDLFFDSEKYQAFELKRHGFYFEEDAPDVYPPYLYDLKKSILQKKAGDKWSEKVVFSKKLSGEYKLLAGAKVVCRCEIHTVKRMQLPELDAELLKKFGVKSKEDLMEQIRKNLKEHGDSMLDEYVVDKLLRQLREKTEFGIPRLAIDYVVGHYWKDHLDRLGDKSDVEKSNPNEAWLEAAEKKARQEIEIQLIFEKMIEDIKEISPNKKEVDEKIEELSRDMKKASQNLKPEEKENWEKQVKTEETRKKIEEKMQHQKAMDFLRDKAKKKKGQQYNYRGVLELVRQANANDSAKK